MTSVVLICEITPCSPLYIYKHLTRRRQCKNTFQMNGEMFKVLEKTKKGKYCYMKEIADISKFVLKMTDHLHHMGATTAHYVKHISLYNNTYLTRYVIYLGLVLLLLPLLKLILIIIRISSRNFHIIYMSFSPCSVLKLTFGLFSVIRFLHENVWWITHYKFRYLKII